MNPNEQLALRLALATAVKACQIARTVLPDTEDYEDFRERIEGAEVELSDLELEALVEPRKGSELNVL